MTTSCAIESLRFRMVTHITSSLAHEVGDVDDHKLSLSTFSGLALFADGVVAKVQFHSIADYIAGAGTFTLYPVIRFDDESVLFLKSSGTAAVDGARTNFTGTVAVIGGRRRFDTVQGDGTLTGVRYTPLSEGADLVSEYIVNLRR
jgi:hypothetical protein